jgi:hypothetical protein
MNPNLLQQNRSQAAFQLQHSMVIPPFPTFKNKSILARVSPTVLNTSLAAIG